MKALYWIDKKSVFFFEGSTIKAGDRFDFKIDENKLKTLIEEKKVGEVEINEPKKIEEKKVSEIKVEVKK